MLELLIAKMQVWFLAEAAPKPQIPGNQEIILQAESLYNLLILYSFHWASAFAQN